MFACNARGWGSWALAVAVVLAACADDTDHGYADADGDASEASTVVEATPASPPVIDLPSGVEVFVEFPRYLQLQRRLEVGFDNQSDAEILVESVGLRAAMFEPVDLDQPSTEVEVGRRRDLQIGLGTAVCPPPAGPVRVEVVADVDGVRRHGLIDVPAEPLERISDTECGREYVLEQVDVGYSSEFSIDDDVVATQLVIDRIEGDEPIEVTNVRGSVLLELRAADPATPLGALAPGEDAVAVPVRLRVIRCDPHAVIESKKTFQLAVWIAVGGRKSQHLVVAPGGDLRAALQTLIDECLREQSG